MTKEATNIILILTDDLGYSDLSCFGSEINTPNLDRLANGGLRFTQFYNSARCCPSRASLLTGLYPHQAGIGEMDIEDETPGYRGFLQNECVTIAEVLREQGYHTYLSGKWHAGKIGPIERGFHDYYGMLGGYGSFYDESLYVRLPEDRPKRTYEDKKFYATDAITDHALDFISESRNKDEPYFLFLSYNAPHFPLQAPKEEINKYVDTYEKGWDKIRDERLKRQKELQIVNEDVLLPPRSEFWNRDRDFSGKNPAWDSLDPDRQKDLARRMAIYAGMVDRMDQNVGRVIENIEKNGELDNTLIFFCSDNGACAEWDPYGFDNWITTSNTLHRKEDLDKMGGPETAHSYGSGWANAANTPLQMYKHYIHEGGICTPLIAHWPNTIKRAGEIEHTAGHFIDFMATFVEITGANYPAKYKEHDIVPMEGESLTPLFTNNDKKERIIYFEHEQNRGLRKGKWKLSKIKEKDWELYDIDNDRNEMVNLAEHYPDLVNDLVEKWNEWAERTNVLPRPKSNTIL